MTAFGNTIKKKTVRWNERCDVRTYRYGGNPNNLWYTLEDIQRFKDDRIRTIILCYDLGLEYVNSLNGMSSRGLENFLTGRGPTRKRMKERRQQIMDVAFDVQVYGAVYSPRTLAQYYECACRESLLEARQRGEDYWEEEEKMIMTDDDDDDAVTKQDDDTQQSCDNKKKSFLLGKAAIIISMVKLGSMAGKWSLRQKMATSA